MNDTEITFITQITFSQILAETNIDLDRSWAYCLADVVNLTGDHTNSKYMIIQSPHLQ